MSAADRRVSVLRNGIEIGRAAIEVADPGKPLGTHAFVVEMGNGNGSSVLVSGAAARSWVVVPVTGYRDAPGSELSEVVASRVRLPQAFGQALYPLLAPDTTLLITDAPVLEENTGHPLTVLDSGASDVVLPDSPPTAPPSGEPSPSSK